MQEEEEEEEEEKKGNTHKVTQGSRVTEKKTVIIVMRGCLVYPLSFATVDAFSLLH